MVLPKSDECMNLLTHVNTNLEHLRIYHWHQYAISKCLRVNTTLKIKISKSSHDIICFQK